MSANWSFFPRVARHITVQKAGFLLSPLIHFYKCSMPVRTLLPGSCAQLGEVLPHCCSDAMNVAMLM